MATRVLQEDPSITRGERHFLRLLRETCLKLYEVIEGEQPLPPPLPDLMQVVLNAILYATSALVKLQPP